VGPRAVLDVVGDSIKGGKILDWLSDGLFLKKDCFMELVS
jgi:hypothetical protein